MDTNERVEAALETGRIEGLWDRRTAKLIHIRIHEQAISMPKVLHRIMQRSKAEEAVTFYLYILVLDELHYICI